MSANNITAVSCQPIFSKLSSHLKSKEYVLLVYIFYTFDVFIKLSKGRSTQTYWSAWPGKITIWWIITLKYMCYLRNVQTILCITQKSISIVYVYILLAWLSTLFVYHDLKLSNTVHVCHQPKHKQPVIVYKNVFQFGMQYKLVLFSNHA